MRKMLLLVGVLALSEATSPINAATPTLVQHVSTFTNYDPLQLGNPYFIWLPNRTGAGNTLVLGVSYPFASGRTVTVSDDKSNQWTAGPVTPANPSEGEMVSRLLYALNVAAGTQKLTITFDSKLYNFQAVASEFYNVVAVNAADGQSGDSSSSAPTVSSGSLGTSQPGDLVYFYALDTHPSESLTGFSAGPGFTLLSADVQLGWVAQYGVQGAAGPLSPSVTVTGSTDPFNAVALALKSASSGTPPAPGVRIVHVCHVFCMRDIPFQFPSSGNLILCNTAFTPYQDDISAVVSFPENTWTKAVPPEQSNRPQIWYATNAAAAPDLRISITAAYYSISLVLYDVTGAAGSPYDETAGIPAASQLNTNNADLLDMPVIRPSTSKGVIFAVMNDGLGPTIGMVGDGLTLDTITYGGEIDRDNMDNADGYAHAYNSTTAPVSFGWVMNSSELPEDSGAIAIAFMAAETNLNHPPVPASPVLGRYARCGLKVRETALLGSDPDGDGLALGSIDGVSLQGGIVSASGGWVFYTAPASVTNNDSFGYTVADGRGGTGSGTVTIFMVTNAGPSLNITQENGPAGSIRIIGSGIPICSYTVEATQDLIEPVLWQARATVTADATGSFEYLDHPVPGTGSWFYRVSTF